MHTQLKLAITVIASIVFAMSCSGCSSGALASAVSSSNEYSDMKDIAPNDIGAPSNSNSASGSPTENKTSTPAHKIGSTVKTDLVEFTLKNASFAKALVGNEQPDGDASSKQDRYLMPIDISESDDSDNFFSASTNRKLFSPQATNHIHRLLEQDQISLVSSLHQKRFDPLYGDGERDAIGCICAAQRHVSMTAQPPFHAVSRRVPAGRKGPKNLREVSQNPLKQFWDKSQLQETGHMIYPKLDDVPIPIWARFRRPSPLCLIPVGHRARTA